MSASVPLEVWFLSVVSDVIVGFPIFTAMFATEAELEAWVKSNPHPRMTSDLSLPVFRPLCVYYKKRQRCQPVDQATLWSQFPEKGTSYPGIIADQAGYDAAKHAWEAQKKVADAAQLAERAARNASLLAYKATEDARITMLAAQRKRSREADKLKDNKKRKA